MTLDQYEESTRSWEDSYDDAEDYMNGEDEEEEEYDRRGSWTNSRGGGGYDVSKADLQGDGVYGVFPVLNALRAGR
jgi:hypothetical protein